MPFAVDNKVHLGPRTPVVVLKNYHMLLAVAGYELCLVLCAYLVPRFAGLTLSLALSSTLKPISHLSDVSFMFIIQGFTRPKHEGNFAFKHQIRTPLYGM